MIVLDFCLFLSWGDINVYIYTDAYSYLRINIYIYIHIHIYIYVIFVFRMYGLTSHGLNLIIKFITLKSGHLGHSLQKLTCSNLKSHGGLDDLDEPRKKIGPTFH